MSDLSVGSIVRCRNREWVLLPSSDENLYLLRPLTGSDREICGIDKRLANLGFDRIEPAAFPLPKPEDAGDFIGTELLWNAARLSLREGAGPFRSLGKISVRPRAYQFVPLLMSLRLDPIRLLIADDVGIGKTIEALLIARELLDRGEILRFCVLCPPYLCDQWQTELREKFHIDAVVIRSGTISQLERELASQDHSVFGYFPFTVVSIDYAKSDTHRANFLVNCPDLVIVDEAHGAAQPSAHLRAQQQRHELLKALAADPNRHLILLTATPHSGIEESFLSLLGLLQADFSRLNLRSISEQERDDLARHFVQRRRIDVEQWIGEETPFPARNPLEVTYDLSPAYRGLFDRVYAFSSELVRSGETLTGWKKRIRFWTALALLRCVMSSPAAAITAFLMRGKRLGIEYEPEDEAYSPYIYEGSDKETVDVQPTHIVEEGEEDLNEGEKRRLRELARLAASLKGSADTKLQKCIEIVRRLLSEGFHPIVWCRYIATNDYVAQELSRHLERHYPELRVISVTGSLTDEERREKIKELADFKHRVLVATDCLSEGINLQEHFTAVVHYDLPWNPNRLEQREGRVDRFGQTAKTVKATLLYGRDNPVDGAVLDVLLRKAKEIRTSLGITVPVPVDSETVMESVLKALFFRGPRIEQLRLFEDSTVIDFHAKWDEAKEREKINRTRFAQRAIKPDEVKKELDETDTVLGDPAAVQQFVLNACQRLGAEVTQKSDQKFSLSRLDRIPEPLRLSIPDGNKPWLVSFTSPAPEKTTFLGRNHPFIASLAQFLLEEALIMDGSAHAPRSGAIRTSAVNRRTFLMLLRIRFNITEPDKTPMLAEEAAIFGFSGIPPQTIEWINEDNIFTLLSSASPQSNISTAERTEVLAEFLGSWEALKPQLNPILDERAQKLSESHRRVRAAAHLRRRGLSVSPYFPPDLLGVLVLLPLPKGAAG
jgi:superfamily II DNA or RNA helicase